MILIVGMNPGNTPAAFYRRNHTMDRINQWCDRMGVHHYAFTNVVPVKQGEVTMRDVDLKYLQAVAGDHDKVIALGGFVSRCLDRAGVRHHKLPHPSPRNRVMNDQAAVMRLVDDCRRYINA